MVGSMSDLVHKKCTACEGESALLTNDHLEKLAGELGETWNVVNEHHLEKEFYFKDFRQALNFTNLVGALAEQEGHHPDIHLSWGHVRIVLWTHAINGLSENDFILAAKIDQL